MWAAFLAAVFRVRERKNTKNDRKLYFLIGKDF